MDDAKFYRALKRIVSTLEKYAANIDDEMLRLEYIGNYTVGDHEALLYMHICYKMRIAYFSTLFRELLNEGVDEKTAKRFTVLVRQIKDIVTELQCERITEGMLNKKNLEKQVNKQISKVDVLFLNYVEQKLANDTKRCDAVVRTSQSIFGFYLMLANLRLTVADFGCEININMREFLTKTLNSKVWKASIEKNKHTPIATLKEFLDIREDHTGYLEDCEFMCKTYAHRENWEKSMKKKEMRLIKKRLGAKNYDEAKTVKAFNRFAPEIGKHDTPRVTKRNLVRLKKEEKKFVRMEQIFEDMEAEIKAQPEYHK